MSAQDLLAKLAEPFPPKYISWRPGASKDNKCMALAYGDLRAYQERLDALCGLDWSVEYTPWGDDRIIARVTINGVTRSSTGESDARDKEGGMGGSVTEAMAFKRACAMFGLGRFLYELPSVWVDYDPQSRRISAAGMKDLEERYARWYVKKIAAIAVDD